MLYKHKPTGPEVSSGGSFMGEQFVDMFAKEKILDIGGNFLAFASGQEVIRRATGSNGQVVRPRKRRHAQKELTASGLNLGMFFAG